MFFLFMFDDEFFEVDVVLAAAAEVIGAADPSNRNNAGSDASNVELAKLSPCTCWPSADGFDKGELIASFLEVPATYEHARTTRIAPTSKIMRFFMSTV
jgi:hypothetical protein